MRTLLERELAAMSDGPAGVRRSFGWVIGVAGILGVSDSAREAVRRRLRGGLVRRGGARRPPGG